MEVVKTPKSLKWVHISLANYMLMVFLIILIPINIFKMQKKKNILSDGAQTVLTDPTYSPALAKLFQQMENNGVFADIQKNLYGHT